jgi:hypothetical protein
MDAIYEIQVGKVLSVSQVADSTGAVHPTIHVQSFLDGGTMDIPLAPAAWEQSLPIEGYIVCFLRYGNFQTRILKIWGRDEEFTRAGYEFGLFPGEVFIQSPQGLGYLKIDRNGDIALTNGDQTSSLNLGGSETRMDVPRLYVNTISGVVLETTSDGMFNVQKTDLETGAVSAYVKIDKDANVLLYSTKDVSIKARNIYLDGVVWAGSGATDSTSRLLFGDVVTAGLMGTHPFDFATGIPIQGSSKVKASK